MAALNKMDGDADDGLMLASLFLWNKVNGPVSRLQVNIDPFTGSPMT